MNDVKLYMSFRLSRIVNVYSIKLGSNSQRSSKARYSFTGGEKSCLFMFVSQKIYAAGIR